MDVCTRSFASRAELTLTVQLDKLHFLHTFYLPGGIRVPEFIRLLHFPYSYYKKNLYLHSVCTYIFKSNTYYIPTYIPKYTSVMRVFYNNMI